MMPWEYSFLAWPIIGTIIARKREVRRSCNLAWEEGIVLSSGVAVCTAPNGVLKDLLKQSTRKASEHDGSPK